MNKDYQGNKGKLLIAVTGGISVYKAVEICRRLIKDNYQVKVMMTESATHFVTPLTFETITQNPVVTNMFYREQDWDIKHISLAEWADLVLVCPATANIIGKLASGIADDFVSTTLLAASSTVVLAPAMNNNMYNHPSVKRNLSMLSEDGCDIIEPADGELACGTYGKGRLEEITEIISHVNTYFNESIISDYRVLVTAGATREHIDPVRFLSNPSSGKMGYSIAEQAKSKGAEVTLVSGPSALKSPQGVKIVNVTSTQDMYEEVMDRFSEYDIIIKTAAVSDYKPKESFDHKIKKGDSNTELLELTKNPDILQELGKQKGNMVLVGFAAETDDLLTNAASKLARKNLDLLVANDVKSSYGGFQKDINTVKLCYPSGEVESLPTMSKVKLARLIIEKVEEIISNRPTR